MFCREDWVLSVIWLYFFAKPEKKKYVASSASVLYYLYHMQTLNKSVPAPPHPKVRSFVTSGSLRALFSGEHPAGSLGNERLCTRARAFLLQGRQAGRQAAGVV